jgi:hypothetical protein
MKIRLPKATVRRQKWGFAVPWQQFLRKEPMAGYLNQLPDMEPLASGPLDRKTIRKTIKAFQKGSDVPYLFLLELLMIVIWYQAYFVERKTSAALPKAPFQAAPSRSH